MFNKSLLLFYLQDKVVNLFQEMTIESSEQVSNWFAGLLNSIRTELEYIDKK